MAELDVRTPKREYPLPHPTNVAKNDAARILAALMSIDADVDTVLTAVAAAIEAINGKASSTFTPVGTGSTPRTILAKLREVVSFADFGAVGDFNGTTGTNNNTAFTNALLATQELYLPAGDYLFSTYPMQVKVLAASISGPGRLFYDNGAYIEQLGATHRSGIVDSSGNLGAITQGGYLPGGEGPGIHSSLIRAGGTQWLDVVPTRPGSSSEFQIYSTSIQAMAISVIGGGFIDIYNGYGDFSSTLLEVGDVIGFSPGYGRGVYKIKAKISNTRLELMYWDGSPVVFTAAVPGAFHHAFVYAEGFCNVNGTAVSWKSGDYFTIAYPYADQNKIRINGVTYLNPVFDHERGMTLGSSGGVQTNVPFRQKIMPVSLELSLVRLQGVRGGTETGWATYTTIDSRVIIESSIAGLNAPYMPMQFRTGLDYDGVGTREHFQIANDGHLGMGGYDYINDGFPTDAKLHIWRDKKAAHVADGAVDNKVLDLHATFNGSGPRHLSFGFLNNFNSGYLQGWVTPNVVAGAVTLNPFGGGVGIGTGGRSTLAALLEVAGSGQFGGLLTVAGGSTQSLVFHSNQGPRWRAISTINGAADGDLTFQHTTDAFVANFTNAMTLKANGNVAVNVLAFGSYTVATLPTPGTAGRIADCSNARVFNGAGTLEAPGAGTGSLVRDTGSAWKIVGTNITAQA